MIRPSAKTSRRISLQSKLGAIILLAVLIPLIMTAFLLYSRIGRMTIAEAIREEQVQTAKAAPELDNVLEQIIYLSQRIRSGALSIPDAAAESAYVTDIRQYIDLPEGDAFFSRPENAGFAPMSAVKGTYWYGIISNSPAATLFCPPRYLGIKESRMYADCSYVSATRINDAEYGSMETYLVLYFPSDILKEILEENLTQPESVSYVVNEKDEMVTSTDAVAAGIYYMDYHDIQTTLMSSNGFLEREVLGEKVYVSSFLLPHADWYLVTVIPEAPLEKQAQGVLWIISGLYIVAAAAALVIAILLARSIAKRVGTVSKQMSAVKTAPPVPIDLPRANDEVDELVDSYNYMAGQINQLLEDQNTAAEELRTAEFKSLQAQINPHFLFNTMEMINQLAKTGRIEETNEAITALSRFYRLTLSRKGSMTTIENEIEHVDTYIKIQNMRFDDGIELIVDIPDELLEYNIPRLTLQPIVENAVLHGILEKPDRRGTILLTGWMEEEDVILLISDDGVGMSSDRMKKILTGELTTGQGSQIAVVNTHRRIALAFGGKYGLSYSSVPGRGTEVTVRIAAVRSEAEEQ